MKTDAQTMLIRGVLELGNLYPMMRFGQLLNMAATLASEEELIEAEDAEDEVLRRAVEEHVEHRSADLGVERKQITMSPLKIRIELVQILQEVSRQRGSRRLGELVSRLADEAGSNLYDIEDELLLDCARNSLLVRT